MRPDIASVVGMATELKWGQVLITPHAYGVVEMHSPDGMARTRGVEVLTKLTGIFDTQPNSLHVLSEAADSVMGPDIVSLTILVPVGSTLYLVSRGKGSVFLKRDNKLARLLVDAQSLSGSIRPGDTIIAASAGFISVVGPQQIMGAFDHLSPREVAEKLTIYLHEKDGGSGGAALIFRVDEPEPVENADVMPIEASKPAPVGRTIFLTRAKTIGKSLTTESQRVALRRLIARLRAKHIEPGKVIPYIVIIFFITSIFLGLRRNFIHNVPTNITETITSAQHSYDEGMALLDLNPVKGRERLTVARDLLAPIIAKKLRTQEGITAGDLYKEVQDSLTRSMRINQVKPELYFDMSLLKKDGSATDMSLFESTIGILDARAKTVFTLGTVIKNGTIVGGGESLGEALHLSAYGDKLYILARSGIHELRLSDQKTRSNIIPAAPEWGTIADIHVFGGNIYLLDTQKSRIWKYVATDKGFSSLFEYLNPDTLPDLSRATNLAIDGSVWVGTATGKILRFTGGKENTFVPQGTDTPLGSLLRVYTDDDVKMAYILDTEKHRVVVFDKEGMYMSQYVWAEDFVPTGFAVSESSGKLFLLRDGKLYVVPLQ